jgi:dolichyl-phosphate-mannose--protein O-mannosyl transferase
MQVYWIKKSTRLTLMMFVIVLIISYFNYFRNYDYPAGAFWDENYYIASAQKYLNGIFFIHEHPPLGQLMIALGEKIIHGNIQFSQFIDVDYAKDFPPDFSFRGYRLFPALCAWLTPAVFLGVLLLLIQNHTLAFILSLLYLFDNALIVHSRGAMLESCLMLFINLAILAFLLAIKSINKPRYFLLYSILLGFSLALCSTTKLTGLIVLLLLPALSIKLLPNWRKIFLSFGSSAIAFFLVFVTVWQIHFSLGISINPNLKNSGYYGASQVYKELIAEGKQSSLLSFPIRLRDYFAYIKDYQKGVPILNLCKVDENGSPVFFWPLGARSINYRWETRDGGQSYQYLYLQANPVVWFIGLFGVITTTGLALTSFFFPLREPLTNQLLMTTFLVLYWSYMLVMSQLDRVMYLYHYFPALLFSFCLFALWTRDVKRVGVWPFNRRTKTIVLSVLAMFVIIAYYFYSPLTYYQPLTDAKFHQRMIFPLWDLRCVKCEKTSFFK